NLHAFFAGERTATVRHETAVGVDLNFAAGESRVCHEAALHKATGRIDENFYLRQITEHRLEKVFGKSSANFREVYFFGVLCRAKRSDDAALVDSDLRLAVWLEPCERTIATQFFKTTRERVRKHHAKRQHFFGFVSRITVHDALIAGAAGVDSHRN